MCQADFRTLVERSRDDRREIVRMRQSFISRRAQVEEFHKLGTEGQPLDVYLKALNDELRISFDTSGGWVE